MEGVVEGDSGSFAVYTMQQSAPRRREVGDGESDAIAVVRKSETVDWQRRGKFYLPMSTKA